MPDNHISLRHEKQQQEGNKECRGYHYEERQASNSLQSMLRVAFHRLVISTQNF